MLSKVAVLSATAAYVGAIKSMGKGKCPFGYTSSKKPGSAELVDAGPEILYPSQAMTCSSDPVMTTESFTKGDYEALATEFIQLQHKSGGDPARFAACLLRLAGHDLMDFRRETQPATNGKLTYLANQPKVSGGSDGCINFADPDNTGLPSCLAWTAISSIYDSHASADDEWCHHVSLADFLVIAAEATTGSLAVGFNPDDPFEDGSLLAMYRDSFKFGRTTSNECDYEMDHDNPLMPNPEHGCEGLQKIFIDHIYNLDSWGTKNAWKRTAAISGAHTIGFAKPENSGYDGFWGDPHNQGIFNNDYYRNIIAHGWITDLAVVGTDGVPNPNKNQWKISDLTDERILQAGRQMMLDTDMCMFYRKNVKLADCFKRNNRARKACKRFDKDKSALYLSAKTAGTCCAWTSKSTLNKRQTLIGHADQGYCGAAGTGGENDFINNGIEMLQVQSSSEGAKRDQIDRRNDFQRDRCCVKAKALDPNYDDCDNYCPKGPANWEMMMMAKSNDYFYEKYLEAWNIATENGWDLEYLED